jgi:hypothetical protein
VSLVSIQFIITMQIFLPRLRREIGFFGPFSAEGGVVVDIGRWKSAPRRRVAGGGN